MATRIVADLIANDQGGYEKVNKEQTEEGIQDIQLSETFISANRHSITTAEDLSERWSLSVDQRALTLKATPQKLTRSALMPLARRYRADRIFDIRRIYETMFTNTMDARCQSIHNEKYCQVFGNKQFFVEAYPIKKKSDCHEGLDKFVRKYGSPDKLIYDGDPEQVVRKTESQRIVRK